MLKTGAGSLSESEVADVVCSLLSQTREVHRLVTLSLGMGVDSAAMLTRWLLEPATRDFDLADLVVVTAMTGDESEATRTAMETHLLPLMRVHGVRYVQVARAGWSETDGIEVLSDSRATERMVMSGRVSLSDEMYLAGTIPQASTRLCSYRFKGWVLDTWAAEEYGGGERRHAIGFAAEERSRRDRDQGYAKKTPGKEPVYPLIDWGWDRDACISYLRRVFGGEWPRSCCGFCPFQAGPDIAKLGQRWRAEPAQARQAVAMEAAARALNPRMILFRDRSAAGAARSFGLGHIVDQVTVELSRRPAAIYEVRRIYRRAGDVRGPGGVGWQMGPDPMVKATKGSAVWRGLRTLATGSREDLAELLTEAHRQAGGELETRDGVARLWLRRAGAPYPSREHYLTVGVAGVPDKERDSFNELWQFVRGLRMDRQGDLFDLVTPPDRRR